MKTEDKARLAEGLGASRVIDVDQRKIGGPLDMLALREEFNQRLQSSGGRTTDPSWKVSRQVPFKAESWSRTSRAKSEGPAVESVSSGRRSTDREQPRGVGGRPVARHPRPEPADSASF
jgi:hypothetical protein